MLYPRDPSLDPQLVWKGKDEQDRQPLEVPVVPVYIQEKIHPQAIVEDVRKRLGAVEEKPQQRQLDLFGDFNGIEDFAQKVDFYQHDQHWSNRMILGDSLLVMTSLAEKEGLKGQVQMIYIDPPYGIKFGSNWQVSTRKRDVKDGSATDASRQPEQVRAFRDTWELGIHSYLAYLRDRLVVSRELLTDSGSIFVQIGDENLHLVKSLLDEVFGSENSVSLITFVKTGGQSDDRLAGVADYVLWYAKNIESLKTRRVFNEKTLGGDGASKYTQAELADGSRTTVRRVADDTGELPDGCRVFRKDVLTSQRPPGSFPVEFEGTTYVPSPGYWKTGEPGFDRLKAANRVIQEGRNLAYVRYLDDFRAFPINNVWSDVGGIQSRSDPKVYVVQTATSVVQRCMMMATDAGDLILDPTCGSGTTAYVAEQWGRRWITMDTSRVSLALARTRIMCGRFPFYLLADSPDGMKKEAEITGRTPPPHRTDDDVKKGFVYRRVSHVTLKAIANNEEIDHIHDKWQQQLEPLREKLNKARKQAWEEWEVPRDPDDDWTKPQQKLLAEWWELRLKRQQEIDDSIARGADQELLYDQPYEDKSIVRVTGPFTVESLSPHRQLSVAQKKQKADGVDGLSTRVIGPDQFGNMIIDNLRKAGIQNRVKDERLKFDALDPWPGEWIHAVGEYTDKAGDVRKVAVCIGPEHGTVGRDLVKEAAKEAVKGVGYDLLVICGFAFDPNVDEETTRYGRLEVQMCRMNPDLSMGDELLKKTGAGNLFMIFGEPDVRIETNDDIACWFIDTDYDSESFFVRHAYFTGADDPYAKLKKALKAEIDEAAWSELYSTRSLPFDKPNSGRIAVKVINHYGDEVLKVYSV